MDNGFFKTTFYYFIGFIQPLSRSAYLPFQPVLKHNRFLFSNKS